MDACGETIYGYEECLYSVNMSCQMKKLNTAHSLLYKIMFLAEYLHYMALQQFGEPFAGQGMRSRFFINCPLPVTFLCLIVWLRFRTDQDI